VAADHQQWDDEDGLEIIYEVDAQRPVAGPNVPS
jgi:hypothetical protein